MRCFFPLFLCLLFAHATIAQPSDFKEGSIRLKGGEERNGYIGKLIPGNPEQIEYKVDRDGEVQLYKAGEIEGYKIYGTSYSSYIIKSYPETWAFAEVVVQGELSLIYRNGMAFLRKANTDNFIHLSSGLSRTLSKAMEACPYVASLSQRVHMNKQELAEHVRAYNECVAVKNPNMDGVPNKLSIGLMAGCDYTQVNFGGVLSSSNTRFLSAEKQRDKALFQFGVDFLLKPHKVSNHIGFYFGAFYNQNRFATTNSELVASNLEVNTYSIEYSELRIPLGCELSRPWRKKVTTYLRAGIIIPTKLHISSSHSSQESVSIISGDVSYEEPSFLKSFETKLLMGGSFGGEYHLQGTKRIRMQLNCNFGTTKAVAVSEFDTNTIKGKTLSLGVTAGYFF
jgi:hypothetical protein